MIWLTTWMTLGIQHLSLRTRRPRPSLRKRIQSECEPVIIFVNPKHHWNLYRDSDWYAATSNSTTDTSEGDSVSIAFSLKTSCRRSDHGSWYSAKAQAEFKKRKKEKSAAVKAANRKRDRKNPDFSDSEEVESDDEEEDAPPKKKAKKWSTPQEAQKKITEMIPTEDKRWILNLKHLNPNPKIIQGRLTRFIITSTSSLCSSSWSTWKNTKRRGSLKFAKPLKKMCSPTHIERLMITNFTKTVSLGW